MSQASLLPGILPPLRPWDYVRLRRLAAGLTIAQAARPHWHRPEHRADVEAMTSRIERPGTVLRSEPLVDGICRSHPFEPAVYRQLRDDPAESHPEVCRGCGCTRWSPCVGRDGCDCTGHEGGSCTVCEQRAEQRQPRRAAA